MEPHPSEGHAPERPSVLQVKLRSPRLTPRLVTRDRLITMLEHAWDVPVTVVVAPAGYGKTTTVAQWAEQATQPVTWISLGPEDNRPATLIAYLAAALRAADPDILDLGVNEPPHLRDVQASMEAIADAMGQATRHFSLVLDDFQVIDHPETLRAFTYLLHHLPLQAHFVLISRSAPRIPLGRLRVNGQLQQISTADLEFSAEEAQAYRVVAGVTEIDEGRWSVLAERSEGWIAGLQLARILVKGRTAPEVDWFLDRFTGGVPELDDYVLEEVLAGLPAALHSFMLRTSVLPFLEPEFCNFVLNIENSASLIRELRERSLFVSVAAGGPQWLRYHHLLADALKRRLENEVSLSERTQLHARIAEWLSDRGSIEEALLHAVSSDRWDIATAVIRRMAAVYSPSDRLLYLRPWLDHLPRDVVMADPELRELFLWSLALTANFTKHAAGSALLDADAPGKDFAVRSDLAWMQASYAIGDVEAMRSHAQGVCDLAPDELLAVRMYGHITFAIAHYFCGEFEEAETSFTVVRSLAETATQRWMRNRGEVRYTDSLALQGRLDDALMVLNQLETNTALALHVGDVQVFWFLANIHLERNDLALAEAALVKALDILVATDAEHWLPGVLVTRGMLDWSRGHKDGALASAERAVQLAKMQGNDNYQLRAETLQATIWVATGQLLLAERWLLTADLSLRWVREFNQPYPALVAVRLAAAQGDPQRALRSLAEIIVATTARRRTGDLVRLYAMKAGLLHTLDWPDEAAEALAYAIDLGANGGFLRSFLDESNAIAGLFNHPLIRGHTHRHYAHLVKRSFETATVMTPTAPGQLLESLSPRELDVLRLVAAGGSNRSVAQKLFISEPTVKKHISNIYGKLQVLNRMQAVALARELGIL